jgi:glutamate synthase (NADPH/NADH) small chain
VDFIEAFKLSRVDLRGVREAVVVGGGNTAIDAVRELIGLGVPSVTMAYRRDEGRMSGYAHEWKAAKVEGARGAWRLSPLGFERDASGAVSGVRFAEVDDACAPTGSERVLGAQLVLLAIGQSKLAALLAGVGGLEVSRGCVVVDPEGRAGRAGYFAGGDCANGGKEVVNAAAEGKRAAQAISGFLSAGGSLRAHHEGV